jgi:hypothetical protein
LRKPALQKNKTVLDLINDILKKSVAANSLLLRAIKIEWKIKQKHCS